MIREKSWFPILYMFCVTAFFSSIVIGLTQLTSEIVKANRELAFEKAVLSVLPSFDIDRLSRSELHRQFTELVSQPDEASCGACTLKQGERITAYALPISGRGFWAPIKGVIGIGADARTIRGIAIYEQNETPGLGAEIAKPAFTNQFRGKRISDGPKPITLTRPGTILGDSEVHAITGATQTSTRLERIINTALTEWRTEISKARANR